MNSKTCLLILLPLTVILQACQIFPRSVTPTPTITKVATDTLQIPTFTPTATLTPIPSFTPTPLPPTQTPTPTVTSTPTATPLPLDAQLRIYESFWSIVNDTYIYPDFNGLDWNAIHDEYRQRISAGLTNESFYLLLSELIYQLGDDHSFYLDPQQVTQQQAEYQGEYNFVGIGIMASAVPERQYAVILSVFPGSPAEEAGLKPRDSIISVNGTPILDDEGFIRNIIRGPEGTSLDMVVQTPGEQPRQLHLTRQRITGDYPVLHEVLLAPGGKRIGYILLLTFMDSTVDEQVAGVLKEMTAQGPLDGLIIDNRMNEGGASTVLEPMLSYFVGGNLGTFLTRSDQYPFTVKLKDINGSSKVPLVVIVGPATMSFGEIFAGILQDTGRAYLIGNATAGNVEVLWGYDFEDGSVLYLANETFRPVNHPDQVWEKSGVIPDLVVAGEFDEYSLSNDPTVLAAIQYLSGK